jgi:hypothetical protein
MNKKIFFFLSLILATQVLFAKEIKIKFFLKFGFVKGGEAELTIYDTVFNGQPAIHYHIMGATTGLAEKLYGVHDIYETTVDAETLLPLKTIRNVQEGSYRRYNETLFYHDVDSIYSQRSGWREVPHNLLDLVSLFFYFVEKQPLETFSPGDAVVLPTINADKVSEVYVKYLRTETIETDMGKVECYVFMPYANKGKLMSKTNGTWFYISKKDKVPVHIEFNMKVGSLKGEIKEYTVDGKAQKWE